MAQGFQTLHWDKIDALCKERNISYSGLSLRVGKSRGWLYTVKKRADGAKVSLADAQRIAFELNCGIHDIGSNFESPAVFDFEAKARGKLDELLPENARLTADLLEFLASATEQEKNDLNSYIEEKRFIRNKIEVPYDQWWKVLYMLKVSEVALSHLDSHCPTAYIFNRYRVKLNESKISFTSAVDLQKRIQCLETILQEVTNASTVDDILTKLVTKNERPLNRIKDDMMTLHELVLHNCAEILVKHFDALDPDCEAYLQYLKSGIDLRRFYLNLLADPKLKNEYDKNEG